MKILALVGILSLLLTGCGTEMTMETVKDELPASVAAPREITVNLPGEAAAPTMEGQRGRYYLCEDYEIAIETVAGGDIGATVKALTGYEKEDLTVLETEREGVKRYDFVWATAGETGEQLGRAAVLDDGNYHYTMTVLRDADTTESLQVVWRSVFESFALV